MKKEILFVGIFLFLTLFSFSVSASVLTVCPLECNSTTIQGAIDVAIAGDVINVSSGVYNEDLIIINKAVSVIGAGIDNSIIDGGTALLSSTGLVRIISEGIVGFSGFTIRNAGGPAVSGGDGGDDKLNVGIYAQSGDSSAIYTIENNKILGTNNADDEEDYGIYSNSGKEKLIFRNNIITQTGSNSILIEKHDGATEISNNILDAGCYGIDPIFYMTYGGADIATLQNISNNIIDIGTGGTDRATAIGFMSSYSGWSLGDGKYTNIQINYNTINNIKDNKRGISLYNDASGDGHGGEIRNAIIKGNKIYGIPGTTSSFGIRLAGYVTAAKISDNYIENSGESFYGTVGRNDEGIYPIGTRVNYNTFINNDQGLMWEGAGQLDAENNYWGDCTGPGTIASGSGDKVSLNVDYEPWLGACAETRTNSPSCVLKTDNVTLYAEISSGVCIDNVRFGLEINGTWGNYTASQVTSSLLGNYSATIPSSLLVGSQDVFWTVYADDCYNHTTQSVEENFYVNKRTSLNINPPSPEGLNGWYVSEPEFSLENSDASQFWYRWDSADNFNYTSPFGLDNIPNLPKKTAGILELNYWGDICSESIQQERLYVDLTSPQIINLIPYNNEIIYAANPLIQAYIDEVYQSNSGINESSVVMDLDGERVLPKVEAAGIDAIVQYNSSDLDEGKHNISVYAMDNAGNWNISFWEFYVDLSQVPFELLINMPKNGTYDSRRVFFNLTSTEEVDMKYINYNDNKPRLKSLCRDCDDYGNLRKKEKTLNEGWNNLTIRAEDDVENFVEENFLIFIDSKEPKISKTLPSKNAITNGSGFYIKFLEENMEKVIVSYNQTEVEITDCVLDKSYTECYINLNLTGYDNQEIEFWYNVSDEIWNTESKITHVKVDTSPPLLNEINTRVNRFYVTFNISLEEKNLDEIGYIELVKGKEKYIRLCSRVEDGNCVRRKRLSYGSHNLTILALDEAGNSAAREIEIVV